MRFREKVKRLLGKKEKVAKLVDKSTRFVDKCLPYIRAFADKPDGLPTQSLRTSKHFGKFALSPAQIGAQGKPCLLRLTANASRRWLGKDMGRLVLSADISTKVLAEGLHD
ncbi:MAG: hypothetical protein IJ545_04770 [Alphaproteobacteria bacterium]|nr:hypothetical protein [Alphaproteobacteria bacterium]